MYFGALAATDILIKLKSSGKLSAPNRTTNAAKMIANNYVA
jgi:hypothetical protein